jgi:hypothetical protein
MTVVYVNRFEDQLRVYPRQVALDLLAGSWGPHVEGRGVPGMV